MESLPPSSSVERPASAREAPDIDQEPLAVVTQDLWFSYNHSPPVLKGLNLAAAEGQITMVVGASGSGKTTLLKLVKGSLKPQRGSVTVLGRTSSATKPRSAWGHEVAYIPQNLGLVRNLTVLENVLTGALGRMGTFSSLAHRFPKELFQEAEFVLGRLGILHKLEEKVYDLSGGERQRVAIARARMQRPRLLLADEFVSQLDPVTTVEIMEIVKERTRSGGYTANEGYAVLQTTHELELVGRYADRVIVLRDGEIVWDRSSAEIDVAAISRMIKL